MPINENKYNELLNYFLSKKVQLVAVSKTKPNEDIQALYDLGQRDFGENYVQELVDKFETLPKEIRWHFIGHLQRNKVKYIASFVHLIHGVDSYKLLEEINKQAKKNNKIIHCLLQIHIAQEETKFGLDENELMEIANKISANEFSNVLIDGLMGMASFTDDLEKVRTEFRFLKKLFDKLNQHSIPNSPFTILSMGMSSDYKIAIDEGSNMVRIGSLLFGERNYSN
jgi:pyridoxal phosphate enzyme (YggS family)